MTIRELWLLLRNKPVKYRFANMSMQNYPPIDITQDPRLPKAGLLHVRLSRGKWMLAKFRLANAHQIFLGPFSIVIRAPWLEAPARAHLALYAASSIPPA